MQEQKSQGRTKITQFSYLSYDERTKEKNRKFPIIFLGTIKRETDNLDASEPEPPKSNQKTRNLFIESRKITKNERETRVSESSMEVSRSMEVSPYFALMIRDRRRRPRGASVQRRSRGATAREKSAGQRRRPCRAFRERSDLLFSWLPNLKKIKRR